MKESRGKYLFKNTLIFSIGNIGSRVITFFLIPLYTNILQTSEYGIADLITTICILLASLFTLNISESIMRFELDKESNKNEILKIGVRILEFSIIIGALIIPVYKVFYPLEKYSIYIFLYIIAIEAGQIFLCDLRGKELLVQYSIGNILLTLLTAILNIYFLIVLKRGVEGYLSAYIIANFSTAIYAAIAGKTFFTLFQVKFNWIKFKEMIKYSAVLIPNTFMWWIMNSSDRIMVTAMVGSSANGIYAISYKLPTLVSTITGIFNQAWSYSAIREEGTSDENEYNNKIFKSLISISILLGIGILVIIKPFLRFCVEKSYYEAWKYTPFLVVGCVYLTMGTFMSTSYTVHKDSLGFLISATIGAITNIGLNYLLIPIWNVYGAAFATCISYVVVFVFRYFHTRKYIKYSIKNYEFIMGSLLLIVSSIFLYVENLIGFISQMVILLVAIVLYSSSWMCMLKKYKFCFFKGEHHE